MPRLKVFCTTSGFYDHVVAAPSMPAALKAWGARTNLFSMGVARQVTDPEIEKKALARPGEVIRFKRSGKEEVEARPKAKPGRARRPPSRSKLANAEKGLEELAKRQEKESREVERQLDELRRKLAALDERHAKARRTAERKVEQARDEYEASLAEWPGD